MDEIWKQARLDELWEAYLPLPAGTDVAANEPRSIRAVEALRQKRDEYDRAKASQDIAGAILATSKAKVIWQLLTLEIGDWLIDKGFGNSVLAPDELLPSRFILTQQLDLQSELGPHPHRPAIDPVPVLLPRWVLIELRSALAALDVGEVHDLVKPTPSGRHGDAWSWDQMRALAVEHVAYLRGQGLNKQIARSRVAAAMKIPANSLRDWESNQELIRDTEDALEAGKLKVILDDNPRYAEGDGNSVDTAALARLIKFKSGPSLADFGRAYRETHGRRHNPDPSAGN